MTKEPQEETYQTLENKALEKFKESVMAKYYGACFECCDFEEITEKYQDFLKSHLQLAYKAGEEKGRDSVPSITGIEITYPDVRQQGIAEERERIIKLIDKLNVGEFEYTGYILADYLLEEIQNNK